MRLEPRRHVPFPLRLKWLLDRPVALILGVVLLGGTLAFSVPFLILILPHLGDAIAPWFFVAFFGADVFLGGVLLAYAIVGAARKTKLYGRGKLETATLVEKERFLFPNETHNGKPRYRVRCTFRHGTGAERSITTLTTDPQLIDTKEIGDDVSVLVLPDREDVSCIVSESDLARCVET